MAGGNTQKSPGLFREPRFRNKPEAFTNPSAEQEVAQVRFRIELTFPEEKGWFRNIKEPFSLHNAKPDLSW